MCVAFGGGTESTRRAYPPQSSCEIANASLFDSTPSVALDMVDRSLPSKIGLLSIAHLRPDSSYHHHQLSANAHHSCKLLAHIVR